MTDVGFLYAADWQAKHHMKEADTYFYVYAHTSEDKFLSEWMGKCW